MGISPSGFNATGESDIRNYYDHIKAKQELYRDQIQKIIDIYQLMLFGTIEEGLSFKFNTISGDDKAKNATIFKQQVDGLIALQGAGVIDNDEIREYVKTSDISGLDYLSDELPQQPDTEAMQIMAGQQPEQEQLLQNTQQVQNSGSENQETDTWQQNLMN